MAVSGTSTYKVAEVWTTNAFNSTSFPTPNIYVGSLGTCSTSAGGTFAVGTARPRLRSWTWGTGQRPHHRLLRGVVGGHPVGITPNAVAAVAGTGGGSTSTNPTMACEVCVFGNVQINGMGDELEAGGGSIDVGGCVWYDTTGATVLTTNGYGIDVDGTSQACGASVYMTGQSGSPDLLDASGSLGIDGGLTFNGSYSTVEGPPPPSRGRSAPPGGRAITTSSPEQLRNDFGHRLHRPDGEHGGAHLRRSDHQLHGRGDSQQLVHDVWVSHRDG